MLIEQTEFGLLGKGQRENRVLIRSASLILGRNVGVSLDGSMKDLWRLHFADWESVLSQSNLPLHRQESTAITIRSYRSWALTSTMPVISLARSRTLASPCVIMERGNHQGLDANRGHEPEPIGARPVCPAPVERPIHDGSRVFRGVYQAKDSR